MKYTKKSFSDKTFTDVIVCRKFAWRSFIILKRNFCPFHEGNCGAWSCKSTDVKGRNYRNCVVVVVFRLHAGGFGFDR